MWIFFSYFEASPNKALKEAEKIINEDLMKNREREGYDLFYTFKPKRTIHVVEYDRKDNRAISKGHKFKLRYGFLKSGRRLLKEWYYSIE